MEGIFLDRISKPVGRFSYEVGRYVQFLNIEVNLATFKTFPVSRVNMHTDP